jgi:prevent-host-death family protein
MTMTIVNIHAAKTNFSRLVDEAASGAEIVIARAGKPVARLVPLAPEPKRRVLGAMEGQFVYPDDFLDPLPDDLLDLFEGN